MTLKNTLLSKYWKLSRGKQREILRKQDLFVEDFRRFLEDYPANGLDKLSLNKPDLESIKEFTDMLGEESLQRDDETFIRYDGFPFMTINHYDKGYVDQNKPPFQLTYMFGQTWNLETGLPISATYIASTLRPNQVKCGIGFTFSPSMITQEILPQIIARSSLKEGRNVYHFYEDSFTERAPNLLTGIEKTVKVLLLGKMHTPIVKDSLLVYGVKAEPLSLHLTD